jgi:hypothetical protein
MQVFGLGVGEAVLARKTEMNGDERGIANEPRLSLEFRGGYISKYRHNGRLSHVAWNSARAGDTQMG